MLDHAEINTQPFPASAAQPAGWRLGGRYRVVDRLGDGGMAEVFRAHDELLDRDVAVKVFRSAVDPLDTQGELRRELELQSLAKLNHPNLITLYDGSVTGDGPAYLVLELVPGSDLATRLREGPLSEAEVRQIGEQIADALAYVHARGMVHRDVKPANILLGMEDGLRARLSDFGVVRILGSERTTRADLTLGTASYVAPEQARGSDVGPPADVYSLGLVLIEALTGERCFSGPVHEALAARLTATPAIPEWLPQPWPTLLAAMTALEPAARPTAAEVADCLRGAAPPIAVAGPTSDHLVPVPAPFDLTSRPVRHRMTSLPFLLAAAVLVAMLLGAGYLLLGNLAQSPGADTSTTPTPHQAAPATHKHSKAHRPVLTVRTQSSARPAHASKSARPTAQTSAATTAARPTATSTPTVTPSQTPSPTSSSPSVVTSSPSATPTSSSAPPPSGTVVPDGP